MSRCVLFFPDSSGAGVFVDNGTEFITDAPRKVEAQHYARLDMPEGWDYYADQRKIQDLEYRLELRERDLKLALEQPDNRYTQYLAMMWACRSTVDDIDKLEPKAANNLNLAIWRERLWNPEYRHVIASKEQLKQVPECPETRWLGGWKEGYRACLKRIGVE